MNIKILPVLFRTMVSVGLSVIPSVAISADIIPGPADAGRIKPEEKITVPDHIQDEHVTMSAAPQPLVPAPEGAKAIHFTLKAVQIEGATAFTSRQLADVYAPYINKTVTLDIAWKFAQEITERYRNAGYFLSRAYVPQQSVKGGIIIINVAEGHVGQVELPKDMQGHRVIQAYIAGLVAKKPVKSAEVESFLLRLNDLPGYSFRAVLSPLEGIIGEAVVKLTLTPIAKNAKGMVGFDNYSSRYLGPNEISASYSKSLLPLQQTTISGLSSVPFDQLRYGTLDHTIAIAPDFVLELNGGVTKAYPGYTLTNYDIDSTATSASVSLNYQWLRQRQENLVFKFTFEDRDVTSDILNAPETRDHIRALRAGATYDISDRWRGYNIANFTLSQGIKGLGSSDKNDVYLSRTGAIPDFTKAELSLSRLQVITNKWSLLGAASGQWSAGTLYSSEQFGYGGQAFGRAYDPSDITGDRGISGSLELRYDGWSVWESLNLQPYAFYDIGTVWNEALGEPGRESGTSAGFGMRFSTQWNQSGNLGFAWPLTRKITAPIYGGSADGPRALLQFEQNF